MAEVRQLAAIMFTDIVGYTAMMQTDEMLGRTTAKHYRKVFEELVFTHEGKIVQNSGDGSLSTFSSVVEAVKCAQALQLQLQLEPKVPLRVGLHLGDIVTEDDEIYGDGINIASRIESMGVAGAILVSGAVQQQLKNHSEYQFSSLGKFDFKNVEQAIEVLALSNPGFPVPDPQTLQGKFKPSKRNRSPVLWLLVAVLAILLGQQAWNFFGDNTRLAAVKNATSSIAVLPLELLNSDSNKELLIQGITEELIRNLGKISSLAVINPMSSTQFKASIAQVSRAHSELKEIDYFLNGTLEERANQLTLNLTLFDRQEKVVWSKSYKEDLARLPMLAGQIALDVSSTINIAVDPTVSARFTETKPLDPEIFELWLKGQSHLFKLTPEDFAKGMVYLNQAKDKNPADSRAWSLLAEALVNMGHSPAPPVGIWQEAKAAAIRAIQLDSLNAQAWAALADVKCYFEWDYQGALICFQKAHKLNPSLAMNHYHYAWYLFLFDSLDKAIEEHIVAQELDPLVPMHSAWLGLLYIENGNLEQATVEVERSFRLQKDFVVAHAIQGRIYLEQQKFDSAIVSFQKAGGLGSGFLALSYMASSQTEKGMELLQQMETPPISSFQAYLLTLTYAQLGNLDKTFEYAFYEPAHAFVPWYRKLIQNPAVIEDPRFQELMDKLNLPMPTTPSI